MQMFSTVRPNLSSGHVVCLPWCTSVYCAGVKMPKIAKREEADAATDTAAAAAAKV